MVKAGALRLPVDSVMEFKAGSANHVSLSRHVIDSQPIMLAHPATSLTDSRSCQTISPRQAQGGRVEVACELSDGLKGGGTSDPLHGHLTPLSWVPDPPVMGY